MNQSRNLELPQSVSVDLRQLGLKAKDVPSFGLARVAWLLEQFTPRVKTILPLRPKSASYWDTICTFVETYAKNFEEAATDDAKIGNWHLWRSSIGALFISNVLYGTPKLNTSQSGQMNPNSLRLWEFVRSWRMIQEVRDGLRFLETFPVSGSVPDVSLEIDGSGNISGCEILPLLKRLLPEVPLALRKSQKHTPEMSDLVRDYETRRDEAYLRHFGADPFLAWGVAEIIRLQPPSHSGRPVGLFLSSRRELQRVVAGFARTKEAGIDGHQARNQARPLVRWLNAGWNTETKRVSEIIATGNYYPGEQARPFVMPFRRKRYSGLATLIHTSRELWVDELVRLVRQKEDGEVTDARALQFLEDLKDGMANFVPCVQVAELLKIPAVATMANPAADNSSIWLAFNWTGNVLGQSVLATNPDSRGQVCGEIDIVRIDYAKKFIAIADCKRMIAKAEFGGYVREARNFLGLDCKLHSQKTSFGQLLRKLQWFEEKKSAMKTPAGQTCADWLVKGAIIPDVVPMAMFAGGLTHSSILPLCSTAASEFFNDASSAYGTTANSLEAFKKALVARARQPIV